ncbi:MAG: hypothetical protein IPO69_21295 [Saprospiraceae bacterium]|nr:hypothetical protein [Saprospiraceae bacterium]
MPTSATHPPYSDMWSMAPALCPNDTSLATVNHANFHWVILYGTIKIISVFRMEVSPV